MRGTLQALAFCHERNVAHGSMGSASILLVVFIIDVVLFVRDKFVT